MFSEQIINLILLGAFVSAIPVLAVGVTSFVLISVVFLIVRNAIGIQQTPPNLVLYILAVILTGFIMKPVLDDVFDRVATLDVQVESLEDLEMVAAEAAAPIRTFLLERTKSEDRRFFLAATTEVWGIDSAQNTTESDLIVLVPTFVTSELTRAFKIGFLLYLPFLVVDLAVSAILMALGMIMMSPTIVSVPIKLALFVLVDGWSRIVQGLILGYA